MLDKRTGSLAGECACCNEALRPPKKNEHFTRSFFIFLDLEG